MTLANALKDEIRRLARKEVKSQTGSMAQSVTRYRREIANLKRQIRSQEKKLSFLEAQERKRLASPEVAEEVTDGTRFSARSVRAQRKKTGLSAADYAKLVGVSAPTVYNWEQGKARPQQEQLASLVALRGIGKREAQAKLDLLTAEGDKPAPKTRKQRGKAAGKPRTKSGSKSE